MAHIPVDATCKKLDTQIGTLCKLHTGPCPEVKNLLRVSHWSIVKLPFKQHEETRCNYVDLSVTVDLGSRESAALFFAHMWWVCQS